MTRKIYIIFDKLAGEAASPFFFCPNDEVAKRTFRDFVTGNDKYPDPNDLSLYGIGEFSYDTLAIDADKYLVCDWLSDVAVSSEA